MYSSAPKTFKRFWKCCRSHFSLKTFSSWQAETSSLGYDDTDVHVCLLIGSYLSWCPDASRSDYITLWRKKTNIISISAEYSIDNEVQLLLRIPDLVVFAMLVVGLRLNPEFYNATTAYVCKREAQQWSCGSLTPVCTCSVYVNSKNSDWRLFLISDSHNIAGLRPGQSLTHEWISVNRLQSLK